MLLMKIRHGDGHSHGENFRENGMNQLLCHITNWSGNGRDLTEMNKIRKQTIESARMNECKSFTVAYREMVR